MLCAGGGRLCVLVQWNDGEREGGGEGGREGREGREGGKRGRGGEGKRGREGGREEWNLRMREEREGGGGKVGG